MISGTKSHHANAIKIIANPVRPIVHRNRRGSSGKKAHHQRPFGDWIFLIVLGAFAVPCPSEENPR